MSNLPFMSRLIERVVANQLVKHLDNHVLAEPFESAYHRHYSTETAQACMSNDILLSLDRQQAVLLMLLDLSAAFDMVDHQVLLTRLSLRTGVCEIALDWARSYLTDKTQFLAISDGQCSIGRLSRGVRHRSMLRPIFFLIYILPLRDIVRRYGMSFISMQMTLSSTSPLTPKTVSKGNAISKLESCIADIRSWMLANRLKLNNGKTEYLQFLPHHNLPAAPITIGTESIDTSTSAKNLGVLLETISHSLLTLTLSLKLPTFNSTKAVGSRHISPLKLFALLSMH